MELGRRRIARSLRGCGYLRRSVRSGRSDELPLERRGDIDVPVRPKPVDRRGVQLRAPTSARRSGACARGRPASGASQPRPSRRDLVIPIDVRVNRVDDLRALVADVLLDDGVDGDVLERVESHVRQVEVHVFLKTPSPPPRFTASCSFRAWISASPGYRVEAPSVTTSTRTSSPLPVRTDRPAHAQHLVVRVGGDDEDPASSEPRPHGEPPLRARPPRAEARLRRKRRPAPSGPAATIVPAGAARRVHVPPAEPAMIDHL